MGSLTDMCHDMELDRIKSKSIDTEFKYKTEDQITELVIDDLRQRSKVGIKKYNTTLHKNNKDDYMNHAYQEALDLAQYLKKEMSFVPMIQKMIKDHPNDNELGSIIRNTFSHA